MDGLLHSGGKAANKAVPNRRLRFAFAMSREFRLLFVRSTYLPAAVGEPQHSV